MLKIKITRKKFLLFMGILILLMPATYFIWLDSKNNKQDTSPSSTSSFSSDGINYSPPTDEEKKIVDQNKENIGNKDQSTSRGAQSSNKNLAKPIITYAGQYGSQVEVGAYISVFEDGGDCTAYFTNGSKTITKTTRAIKNVNTTNCPTMVAKNEELNPKGSWSVYVRYTSQNSNGDSESKLVEVK